MVLPHGFQYEIFHGGSKIESDERLWGMHNDYALVTTLVISEPRLWHKGYGWALSSLLGMRKVGLRMR